MDTRTTGQRLTTALADRYRVERELGQGGMATVYLAHDLRHDRDVAIKVLREELSASVGAARFLREVKIAAGLQHPHILPLLDSGDADGLLWFVMPYVAGQSLRERLDRDGAMPIHETVRLLAEVVDALAEAHARGVVHRDIKPDNVMLSGRHALVTDFGVARAISEASGSTTITTLGIAVGTPSYMSPEQATADPQVDHRADIYAVGVMAYEMLCGRPPFVGSTSQQVLAAHVLEAPESICARRPSVPAALDAIVMRCLAKVPADRFQTASELHAALDLLATNSGATTPVPAVRAKGTWARYALASAGVLGAAVIAFWAANRPPASAVLVSNTQLTRLPGAEEFPVISPDGQAVAYRTSGPNDTIAHVEFRRTDGGDAVRIADALVPNAWSPGGERLLVVGAQGLESRPALGGQGTLIDPNAAFAGWSPDGKQVAYFVGDSLMVAGVNRDPARLVVRAIRPHSPSWSPDGKWIAFVSGNDRYFDSYNIAPSSVWLAPAAGGTAVQLTSDDGMNMSPTWAPDSRRLLIVSTRAGVRDVYQLNLTSKGLLQGDAVRISTGLNPSLIALSADGSRLAYSVATHHANIWKVRLPDSGAVSSRDAIAVTNDLQTIEALDISLDGKWLAFDSDREGVHQLYRMPLAGGPVQRITRDSNPSFKPFFSPDGQSVAYHAVIKGLRRIFVVGIDGGTPQQVSPGTAADERNGIWSPDGRRIAWQVPDLAGGTAQVATRDGAGRWQSAPPIAFPRGRLALAWADQGTALLGFDSTRRLGAQPVDGAPFRFLGQSVAQDMLSSRSVTAARSSDGCTAYFSMTRINGAQRRVVVFGVRLADGQASDVLHFDEPARPHSIASNGIAEHAGWLYFTLSDPQSDIWVAAVTGLAR